MMYRESIALTVAQRSVTSRAYEMVQLKIFYQESLAAKADYKRFARNLSESSPVKVFDIVEFHYPVFVDHQLQE